MVGGWNRYEEFAPSTKQQSTEKYYADDASSPESFQSVERPPLRYVDKYVRPELPCLTKRMTVALLCCIGFIIMFGMRASMSVVNMKNANTSSGSNSTKSSNSDSEDTVSASVESAILWGYFITQVPGGFFAAKYPANKLFGLAIGLSAFLNLFIPAVHHNSHALIFLRFLQGLSEGVTYPACHGIWRYWAPPLERSKLATLAFSGCYAGLMFGIPISGELVARIHRFAPFYFYGFVGILWYMSWLWLVFEKPRLHPSIDVRELKYIESSLNQHGEVSTIPTIMNTPWNKFFTSMPCYAIFVANICRSWNFYLLVYFQPDFFRDVYHTDLEVNTFLGGLPHLVMTIVVPTGGILADHLRKKEILTTAQVRKLFNCGGFGMEATFFIIVAFCAKYWEAITAMTLGVAFSGFAISGFNVNHLDIAPKYASILMGLSNGLGTIAGCICNYTVNAIIPGRVGTHAEWRQVFILSASIHYMGIIFYAIFASGELQPWADPNLEESKQWNQMNENIVLKKPSLTTNGLLQRKLSGKINYGSVDDPMPPSRPAPPTVATTNVDQPSAAAIVPSGNPFAASAASTNPFRQEAVQPEARDSYMHGSVDDRSY